MSRRVSLPGADELFRSTEGTRTDVDVEPGDDPVAATDAVGDDGGAGSEAKREASGRVRHDEKITVYVTADELLDLEHTRLKLRGQHRLAVDRGRIVREAIHLALEGVEAEGEASPLVQRLREQ
ncbi:MAG: hypothetical protein H0U36_07310 [Nocardioidaceae bacterium]|nr:hypothetical protein [Nocardioidaceae bacterium]